MDEAREGCDAKAGGRVWMLRVFFSLYAPPARLVPGGEGVEGVGAVEGGGGG